MSEILVSKTVDARGLACPMPVVRAKKAIDSMSTGEVLELLTTDKGSGNDLKAWVKTGGHELLQTQEQEGVFTFYIKKGEEGSGMSNTHTPAQTVDARGLACPMPIVRARKGMDGIEVGQVLEVLTTDKGSPADFRNWCQQTEQKFLELREEEGFYRMQLLKVVAETKEKGRVYPHEISNAELAQRIAAGSAPLIVDVREDHEYQAGHIPGAIHIPIDQIEQGIAGLDHGAEIAVVCRTARRSDYACQIMSQNGCLGVKNVVPGMSEWTGPIDK